MALNTLTLPVVFLLFHFCSPSSSHVVGFTNHSSLLLSTTQSAIDNVGLAQNYLSHFSNGRKYHAGMSSAISDCVELLDDTMDELRASLSCLLENPNGTYYGTGNRVADIKAWLSAAMANQDTCIEGFKGVTAGVAKDEFVNRLQHITSQVSDLLGMLHQNPRQKLLVTPTSTYVVVAKDGSGNFTNVMDAVSSAPNKSNSRYVIYVKRGVYTENVDVHMNKWNLMLVGDGMDLTVISSNLSVQGSNNTLKTYDTATFAVNGQGFIAQNLTFENTAGPYSGQAVALLSNSDKSVFYRCGFRGYQDTLYVHSERQFYRECQISGTVDFIFGSGAGAAVFQNCSILVRNGPQNPYYTVTAHKRTNLTGPSGFSFQFSTISGDANLVSNGSKPTYLGRPWNKYAITVFMQSDLDEIISSEGWIRWNPNDTLPVDKLYYGEYNNTGVGSVLNNRVNWPGYHVMDKEHAENFTVANLIQGDLWLPATGIPYTPGL